MTGEAAFDPYKTLQVDPEAEDEVVEAAYRRLARKYHPDVAPGPEAQARMIALNRAWEMLNDPVRRAQVDRARAVAAMRAASPAPTPRPAPAPAAPAWRARQTDASPSGRPPDAPGPSPSGTAPSSRGGAGSASPGPGGAADAGDAAWQERTGYDAFADAVRREAGAARGPEQVSKDWTAGRVFAGGGLDPSMRTADGHGAAGPPPGHPSGSVLAFGRYAGWSLGEIGRVDLGYLEWLERMPIGRAYTDEIDTLLRRAGRRRATDADKRDGRGLYRR